MVTKASSSLRKPGSSGGSASSVADAIESLQRLTEAFVLRREQLARSVGLTEAQWRVVEEISAEHFMPSMFARRRECSSAAISKILRQLLDRDLIRVSIGKQDARQRDYALTASGRRLVERLRKERIKAIDAVWRDLSRRDLDRFTDFSGELAIRLESYAHNRSEEIAK
jgi:DNA-binding MarR family transcriptional regulator